MIYDHIPVRITHLGDAVTGPLCHSRQKQQPPIKDMLATAMDSSPQKTIGQWTLNTLSLTPRVIRRFGLDIQSVGDACRFLRCSGIEEYEEVLELRHMTYAAVGKVDITAPASTMGDRWDQSANIIIALHHRRLVGSLRINFPQAYEVHEFEAVAAMPEIVRNREAVGVVSRVCTHPAYRGSDLFRRMMTECDAIIRRQRRQYALGGCAIALKPLYERVGWIGLGVRYCQPRFGGLEEELIMKALA